jgi:fumarate reductase flavoprotein subunit
MVRPQPVTFNYPPKHPSAPDPAIGITRGTGYFVPMYEACKARGIQMLLETRAMALITDPVSNRVLGVQAEQAGKTIYVKAKKAVHMATGGYSMNKEMVKLWCPPAVRANYTESWTGDGHLMGMAIGAAVVNMEAISAGPSVPAGAILVNYGGRRFVDETLYGNVRGNVAWGQAHRFAFAIFDDAIREATKVTPTFSAPTLKELAVALGSKPTPTETWLGDNPTAWQVKMDPDVLEETVKFYNESVAMGKDREFGRTQLSSQKHPPEEVTPPPARAMKPIATPPFHAIWSHPGNSFSGSITNGGLRINAKAQVLDVHGKVIPGLYAAGQVMGGVNGRNYIGSGNAISAAINFGRIAGQNASKETPWS